jgi:hypothetical protein
VNSWVTRRIAEIGYGGNVADVSISTTAWTDVATVTQTMANGDTVIVNGAVSVYGGGVNDLCLARLAFDTSPFGGELRTTTYTAPAVASMSPTGVYPGTSAGSHTVRLQVTASGGDSCLIPTGLAHITVLRVSP